MRLTVYREPTFLFCQGLKQLETEIFHIENVDSFLYGYNFYRYSADFKIVDEPDLSLHRQFLSLPVRLYKKGQLKDMFSRNFPEIGFY